MHPGERDSPADDRGLECWRFRRDGEKGVATALKSRGTDGRQILDAGEAVVGSEHGLEARAGQRVPRPPRPRPAQERAARRPAHQHVRGEVGDRDRRDDRQLEIQRVESALHRDDDATANLVQNRRSRQILRKRLRFDIGRIRDLKHGACADVQELQIERVRRQEYARAGPAH